VGTITSTGITIT